MADEEDEEEDEEEEDGKEEGKEEEESEDGEGKEVELDIKSTEKNSLLILSIFIFP